MRASEGGAHPRRSLGRPHLGERVPLHEEVPWPVVEGDDRVRLGGELYEGPVPDELQITAHRRPDHAAAIFLHPGEQFRRRQAALPAKR